jgi:hypothetical protein
MICRVFQAVVGSSRLPLTSVESPLPQVSLGKLGYFYRHASARAEAGPLRSYRDLIEKALTQDLAWIEKVKLLETLLRATPLEQLADMTACFLARWSTLPKEWEAKSHMMKSGRLRAQFIAQDQPSVFLDRQGLLALLRTLFNEVSLSPYTDLVHNSLRFFRLVRDQHFLNAEDILDFFSHLLRQQGRHLTGYDLVTFHHRGANYPDALLLDAVLKEYLELAGSHPELFLQQAGDSEAEQPVKRIRRRALRQAWLLRRRYEGHLVPDAPTSPGENARVLPPPHVRVPEEQILYPQKRNRRLYAGDPLTNYLGKQARIILDQSIQDLQHPDELRELGLALFLDRPLNAGKVPLEPDQTPLFSYLAFSRAIARSRLQFLAKELGLIPDQGSLATYLRLLHDLVVNGLPLEAITGPSPQGSISLADAGKAAADFLLLWTTSESAQAFDQHYFWGPLLERFSLEDFNWSARKLIVRSNPAGGQPGAGLAIYDYKLRKRLELAYDPQLGYVSRGGMEFPKTPLRVLRVWEETGEDGPLREHDLTGQPMLLPQNG